MRFTIWTPWQSRGSLDVSERFRNDLDMTTWSTADYERLGDFVTWGRKKQKLGRDGLAKAAGITTRTLGDIENGKLGQRKGFAPDTLEAIGLALDWPPGAWRTILNHQESAIFGDNASKRRREARATRRAEGAAPSDPADDVEGGGIDDPLAPYSDEELLRELSRRAAARSGQSVGRAMRRAQDEAAEAGDPESSEHGS